ncbi:Pentapeptide repeat-containing protein [Mesorhizobium albiziae]|uniref:Pentapeptide repeat-containing protein n=2 Tax=Neomesorhizobium albiziae TaxID=335020 RepID=A0A1I3YMJ2_9HYPH|nr:Pentapeptide repeat-containing protein [Mesorhizobium albiziae]
MLFLVHGEGLPASELRINASGAPRIARAPGSPSLTGLGQADFQFSDDIMVWSYEKADYTIRMDVETGMFEQVLLDAMLDGPGGFDARGANARGANARGANARGANARGANARGANARGGGNSD